jgi:putative transposase
MRQLEDENNRLKKIVADLTLDKAMAQDALPKSSESCSPVRSGDW